MYVFKASDKIKSEKMKEKYMYMLLKDKSFYRILLKKKKTVLMTWFFFQLDYEE